MRCVEKIHGGKLVEFEAMVIDGRISEARITGDFFLHPEEAKQGWKRLLWVWKQA